MKTQCPLCGFRFDSKDNEGCKACPRFMRCRMVNVTLYVFPQEEAEVIDVDKEWQELRIIEGEIADVEAKIEGFLKEIG